MVPTTTTTIESDQGNITLEVPATEGTRYILEEVITRQVYGRPWGVPTARAILDIGANVGITSAYFRVAYPDAIIHSIEPDPVAFHFLKQNAAHIGKCTIHNVALFDTDGTMTFNPSPVAGGLGSLFKGPAHMGSPIEIVCRDAGRFVRSLSCPFDLIKIDTEGAEIPIIRSLGNLIHEAVVIHLEFHSHADRRTIDDLLSVSHSLWVSVIDEPHRGQLTYVANSVPNRRNAPIAV